MTKYLAIVFICTSPIACSSSSSPLEIEPSNELISLVDSSVFDTGILLFNADQGKQFWTEFNTQYRQYFSGETKNSYSRKFMGQNPYLEFTGQGGPGEYGFRMALFKTLFDEEVLPQEISNRVIGISFNTFVNKDDTLYVEVIDVDGNTVQEEIYELEASKIQTLHIDFKNSNAKELKVYSKIESVNKPKTFSVDDIYLRTTNTQKFTPPNQDEEFLAWLKRASYNFFEWNYKQLSADHGVIFESYTDQEIISLSGMGYAYAVFIIAGEEGYITKQEARNRILSMLKWQLDQNWFDGSGGWHGIPHHYFREDGTFYRPDVSTIDWAMCAAGIRVAKQYYSGDNEITSIAETLLSRPDWTSALAENNKIAMGFDGRTGEMNDYRWGLAFSEETEIVYLEAVASGDLEPSVLDGIVREFKDGFYPSWFGAGFTYNWLQLWTGPIEPYKTNATRAYEIDASSCLEKFGVPVMGLTACQTTEEATTEGFLNWNSYISNQGGLIRLTNGSVLQVSPAPYGAALALPFTYDKAIGALKEFVNQGYYHEYLGLPDNVRMRNVPHDMPHAPNWDTFDINVGPIILAIEQSQQNRIGSQFLSDPDVQTTLNLMISSFE